MRGVGRSLAPLFVPRCRARDVTTLHGARGRPTPGWIRSSICLTRTPKGLGLTASLASGSRRGTSGAPWNRLSTPRSSFRRLMFLCRRWITNWHSRAGHRSAQGHCRRCVRFAEQTAEQLVEVPTIISYSSLLQRTVEQNVDIPVGRGRRNVGLQGFLPKQSSAAQLASQERSCERIVEQIVDSRVLGGGFQDFRPVQGSSASSSSSREHAGEGVFRTFPQIKKSWLRTRGRNWPRTRAHPRSELMACPWRSRKTSPSQ